MTRNKNRRGSAIVELALVTPLMVALLLGALHFGYLFYIYNSLDKSVRDGARYAATRTFVDSASFQTAIQNVVAYGRLGTTTPIVPGLTTAQVVVTPILAATGRPERIKVALSTYTYSGVFGSFTISGKPSMEVPYLGMYSPPIF